MIAHTLQQAGLIYCAGLMVFATVGCSLWCRLMERRVRRHHQRHGR